MATSLWVKCAIIGWLIPPAFYAIYLAIFHALARRAGDLDRTIPDTRHALIGGGSTNAIFTEAEVLPTITGPFPCSKSPDGRYRLVLHCTEQVGHDTCTQREGAFLSKIPLQILTSRMRKDEIRQICINHGIGATRYHSKSALCDMLENHSCSKCQSFVSVFLPNSQVAVDRGYGDEMAELMTALKTFAMNDIIHLPVLQGLRPTGKVKAISLGALYLLDDLDSIGLQPDSFIVPLPIAMLVHKLTLPGLRKLASFHGFHIPTHVNKSLCIKQLMEHTCSLESCRTLCGVFFPVAKATPNKSIPKVTVLDWTAQSVPKTAWPPEPIGKADVVRMAKEYCEASQPSMFEEGGCQVCGQLCLLTSLTPASEVNLPLNCLLQKGVTRVERLSAATPICELSGPVLDYTADYICDTCVKHLKQGKRPPNALANGTWVGEVPVVLEDLTLAEQLLIAKLRRNRCVVKVSNGQSKMIANVIAFENPVAKIYNKLPLHSSELDDVIAFVFTGVNPPNQDDLKRTPMFVRRNRIREALHWLKLNHRDYFDVEISEVNLASYPEEGVPVVAIYNTMNGNDPSLAAASSVFDTGEEVGSKAGRCPYRVNGLTGEQVHNMSIDKRKAIIARHLKQGGHVLAVGHGEDPASIYNDPQYYPKMFPWLFPFGMGGIGQDNVEGNINESTHRKLLLMYHDKRFQRDCHFIIVNFNHSQIKKGTSGSFLVAKRKNFHEIARQIKQVDLPTLNSLAERMEREGRVEPRNEKEKSCFKLLNGINLVGGHVQGSLTSKKYMRGELWSLMNFLGAPSWFVTISPSDSHHPLCIYWADKQERFSPKILTASQRESLISANPVACARFFHFMVEMFLKYVLQVDSEAIGAFGPTAGYYGTVEQQGRLTLHLHILIWIKGAWSPQEIRDRLMAEDGEFQRRLFAYLESCMSGEFRTGSQEEVESRRKAQEVKVQMGNDDYAVVNDPSDTFPLPPPDAFCPKFPNDCICEDCDELDKWYEHFENDVDNLVIRCNVHRRCWARKDNENSDEKGGENPSKRPVGKGCLNKKGQCTARFPRPLVAETTVDMKDGHVEVRKKEGWINNITEIVTYTTRCNVDSTSLLSGTAVKATIGYVSDYIVKQSLKTYQILTAAFNIFERNPELVEEQSKDSARKLILKVLNSLMSRMEIGGPMAALYLLGNPDRYTSHTFVPFYWKGFVNRALSTADNSTNTGEDANEIDKDPNGELHYVDEQEEDIVLGRTGSVFVGRSNIDDYTLRPEQYKNINLYEWTQCHSKVRVQSLPKNNQSYFPFLVNHCLHNTHWVTCSEWKRETHVPNFIGTGFPRKETQDQEFYFATMLTLFAPWRTGKDLKGDALSWKEAFEKFEFTEHQRRLMQNFNLRYECYDAKDDFRQKMASESGQSGSGGFYPQYHENDNVKQGEDVEKETDYVEKGEQHMPSLNPAKGLEYRNRLEEQAKARAVLESAGWNADFNGSALTDEHFESLLIDLPSNVDAQTWREQVDKEREREIQKRSSSALVIAAKIEEKKRLAKLGDRVFSVPGTFISNEYKPIEPEKKVEIIDIAKKYTLNKEQNRAYTIVANHSLEIAPPQLLMYIGGMAGSGKTQVLTALIEWFTSQQERARLALLAPTGTAASQIGGSTYHYFLGIQAFDNGRMRKTSRAGLEEARLRMKGAEYIFLDEISMVGCEELYNISHQLQEIMDRRDLPFGGVNMIFAGDFAQLPPPGGVSLYSPRVDLNITPRQKGPELNRSLGKATWHQVTTVVMLKQNMRQTRSSAEDDRLRTALMNIRFRSASQEDLDFLMTRMPSFNPKVSLDDPKFRFCSTITAWNSWRDQMNEDKATAFARSIRQPLHEFHSVDRYRIEDSDDGTTRRRKKYIRRPFAPEDQQLLWQQPPGVSEQTAGVLKLCLGMPVVIRNNEATELSITKGQEGEVVGWTESQHPYYKEKKVLETLFVRLLSAKYLVPVGDLPTGVVPLTRITSSISVQMPSDDLVAVQREQVPVLLNFAMTDFASQGKTRSVNVVDLSRMRTHQAIYTGLSRGTQAENTLIVGTLNPKLIMGGLDGYLRGEFRDLNYLDEITRLQFEGALPIDWPEGEVRERRIARYKRWCRDVQSIEEDWHPALKISNKRPFHAEKDLASANVKRRKTGLSMQTGETVQPASASEVGNLSGTPAHDGRPVGLTWDAEDYSCAFDSLLSVVYNLWDSKQDFWSREMKLMGSWMTRLQAGFTTVVSDHKSINAVRDTLRKDLRRNDPQTYPYGTAGVDIFSLTRDILQRSNHTPRYEVQCLNCKRRSTKQGCKTFDRMTYVDGHLDLQQHLAQWDDVQDNCPSCHGPRMVVHTFSPLVMIAYHEGGGHIPFNHHVRNGVRYKLRGLVYYGQFHFVSRVVRENGDIYYHDSMDLSQYAKYEGNVKDGRTWSQLLTVAGNRKVALLAYALA